MDLFVAGYAGLFASAFLAATLLPFYSELVTAAMSSSDTFDPALILIVATAGNTAGATINWGLGRYLVHFRDRRWFPLKPKQLDRATDWFNRYGLWSLLLSWLPWVGDPLTVVAGVLRVNFWLFLPLVMVGKSVRYAVVIAVAMGLFAA